MTTVAVSNTQIASDKQATHSGGLKFKIKTKLYSFNNELFWPYPFHVGMAGNIESFMDIIQYFQDPTEWKRAPKIKQGEGVLLTGDGKIFTFATPNVWIRVDQPYYAIGSGMNFAMGSMAAGSTPYEAVRYASKMDPGTGMGVTKIDL